jgi:N6-adenosine-specific RNA methylase IME4
MTAAPYRCIVADPPWAPRDQLSGNRGAASQYPVMRTAAIGRYLSDLAPPIADDAMLFLWRLSSMPGDALEVAECWGFRVVSEVVWIKRTARGALWFGMGRTVRMAHETCLIAMRGRSSQIRRSASVRSVFEAPVPMLKGRPVHSAKPEAFFRDVVEPLVIGPYLELFARHRRHGWTCVGDQLP